MSGYVDPFEKRVSKQATAPATEVASGVDGVTRESGPDAERDAARHQPVGQQDDEHPDEGPA